MGYILWWNEKDGDYEMTADDDAKGLVEYLRQGLENAEGQERERILKRIKECEDALSKD